MALIGYLRAPFTFFFSPLRLGDWELMRLTKSSSDSAGFSFLGLVPAMIAGPLDYFWPVAFLPWQRPGVLTVLFVAPQEMRASPSYTNWAAFR